MGISDHEDLKSSPLIIYAPLQTVYPFHFSYPSSALLPAGDGSRSGLFGRRNDAGGNGPVSGDGLSGSANAHGRYT
jgi:hypothetical protein